MPINHKEENPLSQEDYGIYITPDKVEEMECLLENMDKARYELKKAIERVKPTKNLEPEIEK